MSLHSRTFRGDRHLEACLINDAAHVKQGASGDHVGKIQAALMLLNNAKIVRNETAAKTYGASTALAVLAYKTARRIINLAYQTRPDDIVGKMTIAALDREMLAFERATHNYNKCAGMRNEPTIR